MHTLHKDKYIRHKVNYLRLFNSVILHFRFLIFTNVQKCLFDLNLRIDLVENKQLKVFYFMVIIYLYFQRLSYIFIDENYII